MDEWTDGCIYRRTNIVLTVYTKPLAKLHVWIYSIHLWAWAQHKGVVGWMCGRMDGGLDGRPYVQGMNEWPCCGLWFIARLPLTCYLRPDPVPAPPPSEQPQKISPPDRHCVIGAFERNHEAMSGAWRRVRGSLRRCEWIRILWAERRRKVLLNQLANGGFLLCSWIGTWELWWAAVDNLTPFQPNKRFPHTTPRVWKHSRKVYLIRNYSSGGEKARVTC